MAGSWGYLYTVEVKVIQEAFEANLQECECDEKPRVSMVEALEYYTKEMANKWNDITIDMISITDSGNLLFHIFTMEYPEIFVQALLNPSGEMITKEFHNIKLSGELVKISGV